MCQKYIPSLLLDLDEIYTEVLLDQLEIKKEKAYPAIDAAKVTYHTFRIRGIVKMIFFYGRLSIDKKSFSIACI